jgi:hypothetical protein
VDTAPAHRPTDADSRGVARRGARAWLTPATVGLGALAVCAVVAVRDPNAQGSFGACPFKSLTGWDCPGCGMMRGTHALLNGDPLRAVEHNALLPLVLVAIVVGYVGWTARTIGRPLRGWQPKPWMVVGGSLGVLVFWLVRNLGGPFAFLSSSAG